MMVTVLLFSRGSAIFLSLLFTAADLTDPCNNYTVIENQEKRSSAYIFDFVNDRTMSDYKLSGGWYRVFSNSGTEMPTKHPDTYRCGTAYPIWLNGTMPLFLEGEVTRKVCTRTFINICEEFWNIDMKNCSGYYVYNLKPSQRPDSAYCFGTKVVKCPDGQSSVNGFYPGCVRNGTEVVSRVIATLGRATKPHNPASYAPIFQCFFNQISSYMYDVTWYINDHIVSTHYNITYANRTATDLFPEEWVGRHHMNMIVKCSVRLKNSTDGTVPGIYHDSKLLQAGVIPKHFQYQVLESQSTLVSYEVTVPVGCFDISNIQKCKHQLNITEHNEINDTCSPNGIALGNIAIKESNACGLTIPTQIGETKIQFNVTGYIDGNYNRKKTRITHISVTSNPSESDISGAWDNITIPIIQVLVSDADEKMKGRHCQVFNDPHFYTADRRYYDYHGAGEHILYQNTKYPYQVNAVFASCSSATCNCGIAIQSGKSLLVVRTCRTVSGKQNYRGLPQPYIKKRICDDTNMLIDNSQDSGRTYVVTLPIGTEITFRISETGDYIDYIFIKPSVLDLENAEGLCGYVSSNNSKTEDDFRKRGESNAIQDSQKFAKSWKILPSEPSLFEHNPPIKEESNDFPLFCKCASERGTDLHCNLTQPIRLCMNATLDIPLESECTSGTRKKRSTYGSSYDERGKISIDDTDDVIEFPPFEILADVYDDSFVPETPTWHNSWSLELAEASCRDYLNKNFPGNAKVASGVTPEDYILPCIEDIKIFGDTRFMPITLSVIQTAAKAELVRNQSLSEQRTADGRTLLEKLTSHLCINNCSSKGQCKKGSCVCNAQFGGYDCSKPKSTPPTNVSLPFDGLCNIRKRACKKTYVYGYFIPPDAYCKIRHFEISKNTRSYTGTSAVTSKAILIHSYMVSCELLYLLQKGSPKSRNILTEGFEISVSNDGSSFGEVVTFLVYDGECFSCEAVNVTCTSLDLCPTMNLTNESTVGTTETHKLPETTKNVFYTTSSGSVDLNSAGITRIAVNLTLSGTATKSYPKTTSARVDHILTGMTGSVSEKTLPDLTTKTYTKTAITSFDNTFTGMTGTVAKDTLPETTTKSSTATTSKHVGDKTAEMTGTSSLHKLPETTTKSPPTTTSKSVDETTEEMTGTASQNKLPETTTKSSPTTTSKNVDETTEGITETASQPKLQEKTTKSFQTMTSKNVNDTTTGMTGTTAKHAMQETTTKSSSTTISPSVGKTTDVLTGTGYQHTLPVTTTKNYQTTAEQNENEEKDESNDALLIGVAVGAVLVIGVIGFIVFSLWRNRDIYKVAKESSAMEEDGKTKPLDNVMGKKKDFTKHELESTDA